MYLLFLLLCHFFSLQINKHENPEAHKAASGRCSLETDHTAFVFVVSPIVQCWEDQGSSCSLDTSECLYSPVFLKEGTVQSLFSNAKSGGGGEPFEQNF